MKHWYRIDINGDEKGRVLIGTSELAPDSLLEHLQNGKFLVLNDLSYRDNQNKIVSWATWDPRLASIAYVNPRFVIAVMPFAGDPRHSNAAT